jgi:hypothetical protein
VNNEKLFSDVTTCQRSLEPDSVERRQKNKHEVAEVTQSFVKVKLRETLCPWWFKKQYNDAFHAFDMFVDTVREVTTIFSTCKIFKM